MTAKTTPEPGPKPDFQVVEHSLYCQTDEGEKVFDLRLSLAKIESFMGIPKLDIENEKLPFYIIANFLKPDEKSAVEDMLDGAKALALVMEWMNRVGERLGASLGESQPSTSSSESTEEPSDTTSEPASE